MASQKVICAVQQSLDWMARGTLTQDEAVDRIGYVFANEDIGDVFEAISPEHHPLLHAAHRSALQRVADEDCLQPERSPFDPLFHEYCGRVTELLLTPSADEPRWPEFTVVCLPWFQPEWALRLVRLGDEFSNVREPMLVLVVANTAIWGPGIQQVETTRHVCPVQIELASRLESLWERMLLSTRASRHVGMGLDGMTYHFQHRHKAGQTWSPRRDTRAWRFVEVALTLVRFATAEENTRPAIEAELLNQLSWFNL